MSRRAATSVPYFSRRPVRRRRLALASTMALVFSFVQVLAVVGASPASATNNIVNGDFETGSLTSGWTSSGDNGGYASAVAEGGCFSAYDTHNLVLPGAYSARVRPSGLAPLDSVGKLTSDAFTAGSSVSFRGVDGICPNLVSPLLKAQRNLPRIPLP